MKANVGTIDRVLRVIVGLALIGVAVSGVSVWGWLGVIPLATGLIKFCPAYAIFGLNTCPMKKEG